MVGSALARRLEREPCEVLTVARSDLDLRRQSEVERWMTENKPQAVFVAAATVGGIRANSSRPGEFFYDNIAMTSNIVDAAHRTGVEKLMFLGSACVYPRLAKQPMGEDLLWTGPLEPTNESYAAAKLAGIAQCQAYRQQYGCDFISVIPTNLYGPGDNFDPLDSHALPALIRKTARAATSGGPVEIWGTGSPLREFMFVDDAADAMVFLMERYSQKEIINIGGGETVTIGDLAGLVAEAIGYRGESHFDTSKPDGMPRKQLDSTKLFGMGWRPKTSLRDGLKATYNWYYATVSPQ